MDIQESLLKNVDELLKGAGELLSSKLIHKSEQPYLEGEFLGLNEEYSTIEIKVDNSSYEFSIEYFESAYIPRPKTKVMIFPENSSSDNGGIKILAVDTDLKVFPFAPVYEFKILKLSAFDGAILFHPEFGRINCTLSKGMLDKVISGVVKEPQSLLVKVVQFSSDFFFIPFASSEAEANSNDFNILVNQSVRVV